MPSVVRNRMGFLYKRNGKIIRSLLGLLLLVLVSSHATMQTFFPSFFPSTGDIVALTDPELCSVGAVITLFSVPPVRSFCQSNRAGLGRGVPAYDITCKDLLPWLAWSGANRKGFLYKVSDGINGAFIEPSTPYLNKSNIYVNC